MTSRARWFVLVAVALLASAYVLPLWRVDLIAPQYPEGLGMLIRINGVEGVKPNDLNSINGLNHYIGMKAIEPDAIPELQWMPWILGALIAGGLLVAALRRRGALHVWGAILGLTLAVGLWDYWRWGYDYGHDLDTEHAIIKIPGMTYSPPVIGSKQLLNFRANSWPAAGGVAMGLAALLVGLAIVDGVRARRLGVAALLVAVGGCSVAPRALVLNEDQCEFCRMEVSDPRFAAQVVSGKGKSYIFDSVECLVGHLRSAEADAGRTVWVMDVRRSGTWVVAEDAGYLLDSRLRSPMGRLAAFGSPGEAQTARSTEQGMPVSWKAILADSAGIVAHTGG